MVYKTCKRILRLAVAVLATMASVACEDQIPSNGSDWPTRPVTLIVPFSAGGGADINARILATFLEREIGQPVRVVNRTGGSGIVGHTTVAAAKPDGYTLGYVTVELGIMHWTGLTEITHEQFDLIAMFTATPGAVIVRHDSPYRSVTDLFDQIKQIANGATSERRLLASGSGRAGIWNLVFAGIRDRHPH